MKSSFIAILSAKGGVGKTTTTINLACALHILGRDVVIVDGDYKKPNIALQLGMTNVDKTLHHTLQAEEEITEVVYAHPSGVKVIPGSLVHEEILGEHHKTFPDILLPLKGKVELALIDSSPGFTEELDNVLIAADKAILVSTPDLTSITDTLRTKRLCQERGVEILGVIITHTTNATYEISLSDIELLFDEKVIAEIPFDENIKFAQHEKYPVVYINPRAKASIAYKKLAASLTGQPYEVEKNSWKDIFPDLLKRIGL
ncbi:MAG: cell division ATPase MinD [Candidatus Woesearchaeota archaeon]